jgi:hypothetical protein
MFYVERGMISLLKSYLKSAPKSAVKMCNPEVDNNKTQHTPLKHHYILSRVRRLYKTGIGLTTGFIGSPISYTHFTTHNDRVSSSEDSGSNLATNSYGIHCHHSLHFTDNSAGYN